MNYWKYYKIPDNYLNEHSKPWKKQITIRNIRGEKIICSRPYPVPKVKKQKLKKKGWKFSSTLIPRYIKWLRWGDPFLALPSPKTNQVHFLSEFRSLYNQLRRKPYWMSKINEILLE